MFTLVTSAVTQGGLFMLQRKTLCYTVSHFKLVKRVQKALAEHSVLH